VFLSPCLRLAPIYLCLSSTEQLVSSCRLLAVLIESTGCSAFAEMATRSGAGPLARLS
jgi:hypothetical protein